MANPPADPMGQPFAPPVEFDDYRLLRRLGGGAMGEVYLAHDLALDRMVAVKFIAIDPDAATRQQFLTEARAIARLQHTNVVAVHRIGETAGRPYLVSEYIDGEGLDALEKPLPWLAALDLTIDLARGLAAAHRRGVLHRDIKPANAILTREGHAKLLDFGLAKLVDDAEQRAAAPPRARRPPSGHVDATESFHSATDRTLQSDPVAQQPSPFDGVVGTPHYMAPELWDGKAASPASDVYALGVLLYELVSGRLPRPRATTIDEVRRLVSEEEATRLLEAAPHVPRGLAAVVDRCLAREPAGRFDSGDALCTALEQARVAAIADDLPTADPYRGLAPFEAEHRDLFFGRRTEVREVLDRLRHEPMVVVAGNSGVGKSSLCRAGVLPALEEGGLGDPWRVISLFPGKHPMAALTDAIGQGEPEALARDLGRTVVFIDQLEEMLTLAEPVEAARFAEVLAGLASARAGVRVLATLRGDFVTRVASLPDIGALVARAIYILRPLSSDGLRDAVVGPARTKGYELETEAMVDALVDSVDDPGALPLLQFTLAALWERRDEARRIIPAAALGEIGGVAGALARHADALVDGLLPAERAAAWVALGRLVTHEGTRAVMTRTELDETLGEERAVIDRLVGGRLIVAAEERVSLVHETLVTAWPRFAEWRREHAEGARLRDQLGASARLWSDRGRPKGLLWRGDALAELKLWKTHHPDELLTGAEAAFTEESLGEERRGRRNRRILVGAILAGLSIALVVTLVLRDQAATARRQIEADFLVLLQDQGRRLLLEDDVLHAYPYLAEAYDRGGSNPALELMLGRARRYLEQQVAVLPHEGTVMEAMFTADGERIVTASHDGFVRVWDRQGKPLHRLGHGQPLVGLALAPDGQRAVASDRSGRVLSWDLARGTLRGELPGRMGSVALAYSADGTLVAVGGSKGPILIWDDTRKLPVAWLVGHTGVVRAAHFRGGELFTAGLDGAVWRWDVASASGRMLARETSAVYAFSLSEDARLASWSTAGGLVVRHDLRAGTREEARPHAEFPYAVTILRGSETTVSVAGDGSVAVWPSGGSAQQLVSPHPSAIFFVAGSADGSRFATTGFDGSVVVWQAARQRPIVRLSGHRATVRRAGFDPRGELLVTAGLDWQVRLWRPDSIDLADAKKVHAAAVRALALDGGRVASVDAGGGLQLHGFPGWAKPATGQVAADPVALEWSAAGLVVVTPAEATLHDGQDLRVLERVASPGVFRSGTVVGGEVVIGSADGVLWSWRPPGTLGVRARTPGDLVATRALSGTGFATGTASGDLVVWEGSRPVLERKLGGWVNDVQADHARGVLLAATSDPAVRVWTRGGEELPALEGHSGAVVGIVVLPDGLVLTASADATVRVWDPHAGSTLAIFRAGERLTTMAATRDGTQVFTGGWDGHISVWRVSTTSEFAAFRQGIECRVPFVLDGRRLMRGTRKGCPEEKR